MSFKDVEFPENMIHGPHGAQYREWNCIAIIPREIYPVLYRICIPRQLSMLPATRLIRPVVLVLLGSSNENVADVEWACGG